MKVLKGKATIITFSALCLIRPYLSVLTTTPNNWKEGLMGQVPTLGASFRRKETTIKRGEKETEGGAETPHPTKGTGKSSLDCAEEQSSLVDSIHEEHRDYRCS